jgi:hypothetical protein
MKIVETEEKSTSLTLSWLSKDTSISVFSCSTCVQMAKHVEGQRDYEKAIKYYKEALVYNENDSKVSNSY